MTIFVHFLNKNPALSYTNGPLTLCYISEKTNGPIPRKLWTDKRMDGQNLFYRTLLTEARIPIRKQKQLSLLTWIYSLEITRETGFTPCRECYLTPSQFKLTNLFTDSVSFSYFHNKLISSPVMQDKKIKTCHKWNFKQLSFKSLWDKLTKKWC